MRAPYRESRDERRETWYPAHVHVHARHMSVLGRSQHSAKLPHPTQRFGSNLRNSMIEIRNLPTDGYLGVVSRSVGIVFCTSTASIVPKHMGGVHVQSALLI